MNFLILKFKMIDDSSTFGSKVTVNSQLRPADNCPGG